MRGEESCFPKGGGRPRLLKEQCGTCIFRRGNLMHLSEGRLAQMIREASCEGSQGIICHQTLSYGGNSDFGGALCRGYYDAHGFRNNFIRCIERIGGFAEVDPPEEEVA